MKFTLSWLKDHLETDASIDTIVDQLTAIGLEVEGVEDRAAALAPFRIARVVDAKQHPNADRLRVLTVDPGDGSAVQVVCGAPNARAGLVGVFAAPGTHIPGTGVDLSIGSIRGVESRGMMLSEREMGLSEDHDGIVDLPQDAPVGTPYVEWADVGDPVIEIGVTPNRADCLGIRGIARDLAAAGLGTLKSLEVAPFAADGSPAPTVTIAADDLCPAFALRLIEGVSNGPSPDWMQRRLVSIGLRPINALVDVTNYLTYDVGRPLHVFDADKVAGDLVVRRAQDGERFEALDTRTYTLSPEMVVIADDNGVESLGGIMGGEASGSSETTTRVLVESALWDPINIARTGRTLGIHSDARHRFERGVDAEFTLPGLDYATRLILDLCGGTAGPVQLAGAVPDTARTIAFPATEVARLSGLDVDEEKQAEVLERLGFAVTRAEGTWTVRTPSWRADVEGKADLVEEIVRIVGIDDVAPMPLVRVDPVAPKVLTTLQQRIATVRRALASQGMTEAVTWSFVSHEDALAFGGGQSSLQLANPIAEALSDMRPSLLAGLVRAVTRNVNRGHPDLALFEVGQVFAGDEPADQTTQAAGVRQGRNTPATLGRHWDGDETADVFDAKSDIMAALTAIGGPADRAEITRDAPPHYHPGRSGTLRLGSNILGHFGELHPAVLAAMDAPERLVAFELTMEKVPEPRRKATKKPNYSASQLMPVRRDFAFVVPEDIDARAITRAARSARKDLVSDVAVFDVYRGVGVPDGQKSVAVEAVLQPKDRTLTDDDIDKVSADIIAAVTKATGATLRA
ncbi:phenylalanine--tRNA ligase subunit beta [Acuticoccus sp. I52.16.1]|uniref:phenylalanine--tRNA ligase subunit beta n=1 Tax=Acuticoccus sp. I52.16.1 TaxID=2928472 RepID=UPI001FD61176|nr:phenylalanine--tRNA ligase subunit beta [Acuticoccus sp. I52.16.1]UOM36411.1 phenylalanine--tRNA ligase subunit beta [Acuticoccus sp. I52.16.1]